MPLTHNALVSVHCDTCNYTAFDPLGNTYIIDGAINAKYYLYDEEWIPVFDRPSTKTPSEIYPSCWITIDEKYKGLEDII